MVTGLHIIDVQRALDADNKGGCHQLSPGRERQPKKTLAHAPLLSQHAAGNVSPPRKQLVYRLHSAASARWRTPANTQIRSVSFCVGLSCPTRDQYEA
jgi:hypothetical protein